jgi:hypothetical protein
MSELFHENDKPHSQLLFIMRGLASVIQSIIMKMKDKDDLEHFLESYEKDSRIIAQRVQSRIDELGVPDEEFIS